MDTENNFHQVETRVVNGVYETVEVEPATAVDFVEELFTAPTPEATNETPTADA
jgi:hypothetical protein